MAGRDKAIPRMKLPDGNSIPILGYGTGTSWAKSSSDGSINKSLVENITKAAHMGFVHLDGAEIYNTEKELGAAIKASKIPRDKLFITTKVLKNIDDIASAIDASLKKLGLDYVDLYLIHSPFFPIDNTDHTDKTSNSYDDGQHDKLLQQKWHEMESVKKSGKARSIGVSNYSQHHLQATLKTATDPPAINQIEFHPYLLQNKQKTGDLITYQRQNNIALSAYSPLIPITRADQINNQAQSQSKSQSQQAKGEEANPTTTALQTVLSHLARKYYVNPSEILLRWCIQQDMATVTTTSDPQRMSDYLRVLAIRLTPREVEEIADVGASLYYRAYWSRLIDGDGGGDGDGGRS